MPDWIDTAEASALSGYNQDYLCFLLRMDPATFKAEKQGMQSSIDTESFMAFVEE